MKWYIEKRPGDSNVFHLEWDDWELIQLQLDGFDRALLRECDESVSLADKLLALEMIARRIEQQAMRGTEEPGEERDGKHNREAI